MKRALIVCLTVVLVITVGVVLSVLLSLNRIIKSGVERIGPEIAGVPVTLEQVDISSFTGEGDVVGLLVGNPPGFGTPSAIELSRFKVNISVPSIFSDCLVIEEILIEGPGITCEFGRDSTNLGRIRDNMVDRKREPGGEPPDDDQEKKPRRRERKNRGRGRKVIIDRLLISGGTINLGSTILRGASATVRLQTIELKDIGRESGGLTAEAAIARILTAIINSATGRGPATTDLLQQGATALGEEAAKHVDEDTAVALEKALSGLLEGINDAAGKNDR